MNPAATDSPIYASIASRSRHDRLKRRPVGEGSTRQQVDSTVVRRVRGGSESTRRLLNTSPRLWHCSGTFDRSGGEGGWAGACREGGRAEWRQREWHAAFQPLSAPVAQSSCGLWRVSQRAPRTVGAADEGDEEETDLLPVVPRDDESEGTILVCHRGDEFVLRSRIVLGAGRASTGICTCLARPLSMKLSSAPELTRIVKGREL